MRTAPLSEVLAFRARLRPDIAAGFVDAVSTAHEEIAAGATVDDVSARLRATCQAAIDVGNDPQRAVALRSLWHAVDDFLRGVRP